MIIHFYDNKNQRKTGQLDGSDFTSIKVDLNIDDFNTATLNYTINDNLEELALQGFENVYIEDDAGKIIFGGIMVSYTISPGINSMNLLDHRWVLSRLVLDTAIEVTASDDILDTVEELINLAKTKRSIPLTFDRSASAFNTAYSADLRFEVGDNIASCIQKIIQTGYARWAVEYTKIGNDIIGSLRVRSVRGVTPEGVGIARGLFTNEDGELFILRYEEGGELNNIQDFSLNYDLANYASRMKVGVKIGGENSFVTALPAGNSGFFENTFGRTEGYTTDYNANSEATAQAISAISQVFPKIDVTATITPDEKRFLKPGDRVSLFITIPMLQGVAGNLVRIDAVSYSYDDGELTRTLLLNFVSPQKRTGSTGLLQTINALDQQLDGLNKNYLNSV